MVSEFRPFGEGGWKHLAVVFELDDQLDLIVPPIQVARVLHFLISRAHGGYQEVDKHDGREEEVREDEQIGESTSGREVRERAPGLPQCVCRLAAVACPRASYNAVITSIKNIKVKGLPWINNFQI